MELKDAIEKLNNFKSEKLERDKLEINPRGGFKIGAIFKYTELDKAIDTVLNELDNRIPRKDIEDKIEELNEGINRDMKNYDKIENKDWKLAIYRTMQQRIEIRKTLNKLLNKE